MITQEQLKELFEYRDGRLWRRRNGKIASVPRGNGYMVTHVNRERYPTHRLIYLYFHGYLPQYIDHVNNIRHDNRIENLQEASWLQNVAKRGKEKKKTRFKWKGILTRGKKFTAQISISPDRLHLEKVDDPETAAMLYNEAALEWYGKWAILNEAS